MPTKEEKIDVRIKRYGVELGSIKSVKDFDSQTQEEGLKDPHADYKRAII
jgi:hypothetical protein